jgi:hypothetical protein
MVLPFWISNPKSLWTNRNGFWKPENKKGIWLKQKFVKIRKLKLWKHVVNGSLDTYFYAQRQKFKRIPLKAASFPK